MIDDIGYLGNISEEEEDIKSIAKLFVETEEGPTLIFSKMFPSKSFSTTMYLPSVDRTLYGKYAGVSPDGLRYYKFMLMNVSMEQYYNIKYELVDGGWVEESAPKGEE